MDYVLFRLGIRTSLFFLGFLISIFYIVRKRSFLCALYFKKEAIAKEYTGRNDVKLLRCLNLVPFVALLVFALFLANFALDFPHIISGQYAFIEGDTVSKSHGGADVPSQRRSIWIQDKVSGNPIEITVFSKYIDANEFLRVQYLPHTRYGVIEGTSFFNAQ